MKAVTRDCYGPPEILRITEIGKPAPKDDEVLIKLRAVSLNASDWELLTGRPIYARIFGLMNPRIKILSSDIAGVVEAVGKKVTRFKPGDAVFGDVFGSFGGFAEYVCAPANKLMPKPDELRFEQAATLLQGAMIAWQGLHYKRPIVAGDRILINGAGGSAGSFAIPLAKKFGAQVTAVDNNHKLDFMLALGADHVMDYRSHDFTADPKAYDLILDLAAWHPMSHYLRVLAKRGRYAMVGGSISLLLKILLTTALIRLLTGKSLGMLTLTSNPDDLTRVANMAVAGELVPAIDRVYDLAHVPEALRDFGGGLVKGKQVIVL